MPVLRRQQSSVPRQGTARSSRGDEDSATITELNARLAEAQRLQKTRAGCAFPGCEWEGVEGTADECREASIAHRLEKHPKAEAARRKTADRKATRIAKARAREPIVDTPPPPEPSLASSDAYVNVLARIDRVASEPSHKRPRWTLSDTEMIRELLDAIAS